MDGSFGILGILCLAGMIIMNGPMAFVQALSVVVGVIGTLGAVGWKRIPAITVSLLGSASLVYMLDDYGIGVASVALMVVCLLAGVRGLRLLRWSKISVHPEDPFPRVRTREFTLTLLLVIANGTGILYVIYLWNRWYFPSLMLEWIVLEAMVIASLFLGILWLCLRDPLRPVVVLILIGSLWPWLSPLLLVFMIPQSQRAGDLPPSGMVLLPLGIPMIAAGFLALRGCGMRLIWVNETAGWRASRPEDDAVSVE